MIIVRGLHNFTFHIPHLCLSMGNFDGLHLGHQAIIKKMMRQASRMGGKGAVLTFTPHPRWVLTPTTPPPLLSTLYEQACLLAQWNLDILILARFDQNFSAMEPEEFIKKVLIETLNVKEIFVGEHFTFGLNRGGTVRLLEMMGKEHHFRVTTIPLKMIGAEVVSSTLIRNKIQTGDIEEAARFLGHEYTLTGRVGRGSGRGKQLGFPTANIKVNSKVLPPSGVYAVKINYEGNLLHGLANVGYKPTFGGDAEMGVEAHILDFNKNLYGKKLMLYFQKRVREEKRFPSAQALADQIKRDLEKI